MEETIGYEALFSAEEWDSLDFGEWTDGDDLAYSENGPSAAPSEYGDPKSQAKEIISPSGVTLNGKGSAALSQEVASEGVPPTVKSKKSPRLSIWGSSTKCLAGHVS